MRPVFSYYGKLSIDDSVVANIVRTVVSREESVSRVSHIRVRHRYVDDEDQGLDIVCEITLSYGGHIPSLIEGAREKAREAVEFMTGMVVHEIDIVVKALYVNG